MGAAKDDPYLWAALAALLAGLALGQASRWAVALTKRGRSRPGSAARRRGRSARALALLGLALLAATALLVFPPKRSLLDPILLPWAASALALGALAGLWPRAAGLPAAALIAGALVGINIGLEGWLTFRGPGAIASLLPFEVSRPGPGGSVPAPSFKGELELAERDSVPVAQEVGMEASSVAMSVESLELRGPLALAAALAGRGGGRFYRVVGLSAPGGLRAAFPPASALLSRIAELAAGEGLEPGGSAGASALGGLAARRRATSPAVELVALEPARFSLDAGMSPVVEGR